MQHFDSTCGYKRPHLLHALVDKEQNPFADKKVDTQLKVMACHKVVTIDAGVLAPVEYRSAFTSTVDYLMSQYPLERRATTTVPSQYWRENLTDMVDQCIDRQLDRYQFVLPMNVELAGDGRRTFVRAVILSGYANKIASSPSMMLVYQPPIRVLIHSLAEEYPQARLVGNVLQKASNEGVALQHTAEHWRIAVSWVGDTYGSEL